MREYGHILGGWLAAVVVPVRVFLSRTHVKMLWVFGSVAGLVAFSASLAAVNRGDAAYGIDIDSHSATTQQLQADDTTIGPVSQQRKTVITQTQQMTSDGAAPHTSLRVNNTPIAVPQQGTVHKDIRDANGQTTVDMSVSSTSTGDSSSRSSSSIMLQSTTESTSTTESSP